MQRYREVEGEGQDRKSERLGDKEERCMKKS